MFIQTQPTPNPNALKFLSEKKISSVGTQEFQKANIKKINNYFIKNLLNLDGVELVLVSENFLSVKKNEKISWDSLQPSIVSSLNDYFQKIIIYEGSFGPFRKDMHPIFDWGIHSFTLILKLFDDDKIFNIQNYIN